MPTVWLRGLRVLARSWWILAGVLVVLVGCAAVPTSIAGDAYDSVVGGLGESSSDACVRESIESAGWPQLEAGTTVSFSLRLSVR